MCTYDEFVYDDLIFFSHPNVFRVSFPESHSKDGSLRVNANFVFVQFIIALFSFPSGMEEEVVVGTSTMSKETKCRFLGNLYMFNTYSLMTFDHFV